LRRDVTSLRDFIAAVEVGASESLNAVPVPVEARTVADQINDPDSKRCAIALCCSLPSH